MFIIPALRRQRQKDPWGALTSQPSLISEPPTPGLRNDPFLKTKVDGSGGITPEEVVLWPCLPQAYAHAYMYTEGGGRGNEALALLQAA